MKALSLSQPWCWAVMHELVRKHIENRSWQPPIEMIGQVIAIQPIKLLPIEKGLARTVPRWCPLRIEPTVVTLEGN